MYNSQYYTCEQIDERLLQGYLDDYNNQNGTNLTKAQFLTQLATIMGKNATIDNLVAQIGYYVCETAAGTVAKTLVAANYELLAGGSLKVKFLNKNTANNATLNINSKGDKALYYQGERVSSSNTWEENEVVEIFYDGTNYYANNVKGGSGDGVYDVSVNIPDNGSPSQYATLSAALAAVPVNVRKPGMSIKFINSSNSRYEQWRYMLSTLTGFTTEANWQGVDKELIAGSPNLVESGVVAEAINKHLLSRLIWSDGYYRTDGSIYNTGTWKHTQLIPINIYLTDISINGNESVGTVCFFDEHKDFLSCVSNASGVREVPSVPAGAKFYTITKSVSDLNYKIHFDLNTDIIFGDDLDLDSIVYRNLEWHGGYYNMNGVLVSPHSRFVYTDLLDVELIYLKDIYLRGLIIVGSICFFDKYRQFISSVVVEHDNDFISVIPSVPANAKYFAISRDTTDTKSLLKFNITPLNLANVKDIPLLKDYGENLYYDPYFKQSRGAAYSTWGTYASIQTEQDPVDSSKNWLVLDKEHSEGYRPIIPIVTIANSELTAGDFCTLLIDYNISGVSGAGNSFVMPIKNKNGNLSLTRDVKLLDLSNGNGTLEFEFIVPNDANEIDLHIGMASTLGTGFSFKFTNIRLYSKDRRLINIPTIYKNDRELTPVKNLFNKDDIVEGKYIDVDGNIISLSTIGYSNPIFVKEGETYHTNVPHNICFYNMYGNFVTGLNTSMLTQNNNNFTVPSGYGIVFIRANCYYSNLDVIQIEKGSVGTDYESFKLTNKYLESNSTNIVVDDETIGKTPEGEIFVKDGGLSEAKLDAAAQAKLNQPRVINQIGDITITGSSYTYLATDYLNADGNVSGQENTVAEWQAMINACAVTGGTIFFPDGHYVCKPGSTENKYLVLKDSVILKGASRNGTTIELQTGDEAQFFRFETNSSVGISDMTVVHNLMNQYIEPDAGNMGKRITLYVNAANTNFVLNNLHIKAINLNNGYNTELDNFREASAAYMLMSLASNGCRVEANNCYGESPAWGIFNISSNSDLIWNGDLRCWYKCTGAHGTNSRIIINGNLTSYGSGSYACISCSGGHTIVNGNLYRVPEVDALYSLNGSAIYAGSDDESTILVNGNIYTCSGVYQGTRGVCEINGNVYCLDKDYTREIDRTLFDVGNYNGYFGDVKFTGNISCIGGKNYKLFSVNGGKLEVVGNSFTSCASTLSGAGGEAKIKGNHKVIKDRFMRVYGGKLYVSGLLEYSHNHEMVQLVAGVAKEVYINNACCLKAEADLDRRGNDVTTESGTGNALFFNHSAEVGTKVVVADTLCNAAFSENAAFNAEIHNVAATSLGVAVKSNTLNDL